MSHFSKYISNDYLAAMPEVFGLLEEIITKLKSDSIVGLRPHQDLILRAFQLTPLSTVKVVLLANSPYKSGIGNGLAYDCVRGVKVPPSLSAIIAKISEECGENNLYTGSSYLDHLPGQGVLLLNKALTCSLDDDFDHKSLWRPFFESFVKELGKRDNIVWGLLGEGTYNVFVSNPTHSIIEFHAPSPLAGKGFQNNKFTHIINNELEKKGLSPIQW